jgi:hypothetical protein
MMKQLLAPLVALAIGLGASTARAQDATIPDSGVPTQPAPALPAAPPPPPAAAAPAATPAGQWVYTSQYGWIWEPYGQPYTYVNADVAYTYAYYPAYGWRWVYSPWVIGVGPEPYWGVYGSGRFVWYGRYGGYHGAYLAHHRGGYAHVAHAPPSHGGWGGGHASYGGGHASHGGGHGHR